MSDKLRFALGATLVGGGALDRETLDLALVRAPDLVAADGGANALRGWGLRPRAVIGDMDSAQDLDHWRHAGVEIRPIAEQDSTDLEKCLDQTDAPHCLCVGFLGRRFDHTLAALHALLRFPARRVILIGEEDLVFLAPVDWRARLAPGARVSFYPLRPFQALGSEGLEWPLDGLTFEAGARIGTSNRASRPDVCARFAGTGAAVMVERRFLDAVLDSLT